jgi:hypothetical protein
MTNKPLWWSNQVDGRWTTFVVSIAVKFQVCLALWNVLVDGGALAKHV